MTVEDLATITAKTLIINGDHDDIAFDHVLSMYAALPDAQLFIVPGGDHFSNETNPDLINKVALEFLNAGTEP